MADTTILYCDGLLDGTGAPAIRDAAIRLDRATITAVGPATSLGAHPDERLAEHDFRGYWVTPGLIDEHTHVSLAMGEMTYEEMIPDPDEMMVLRGVLNLRRNLTSGVTSIRDNGARNRIGFMIREAIHRGFVPGPRLLVCGRPITCTRGHFWWCNEEADGAEQVRKAVRRLVHEGADHIKIMASGGGTRGTYPGRPTYSSAELSAAIEEAHAFGRLTTAHCLAKESMARAVEAGVDLIEHALFLDPDGVARFDRDLADRMREKGTYICPTLQAASGYERIQQLEERRDSGQMTREDEKHLASLHRTMELRLEIFGRMLDADLLDRMVAGSDRGGGRLIYDLILMARGGMTPHQVLQSATRVAAEAIGLGEQIGTLEPGKIADLIVVDGNPTENIAALGRIKSVFQSGERVA
jgi:imidazolonepropionase-like amidohydrolase